MEEFNNHIIEKIEVTKSFLGKEFKIVDDKIVNAVIKNTKVDLS